MTSFLNATPIFSYRILSLLYSLILSLLIISLKKNFTSVQLFPFNRALYLRTIRIYLKPLASPLIPNIQIIFNPILARYRYRLDQKNFQKKNPMESLLIPNIQIFSFHSRSISIGLEKFRKKDPVKSSSRGKRWGNRAKRREIRATIKLKARAFPDKFSGIKG